MALEDAGREIDRALTGDLRGLAYENAFAGATSFLRRRYAKDPAGADVAVIGVPFDAAVTHRPGTRFGPRALREASTLQPFDPPWGWPFDPLSDLAVVDAGDIAFDYARTDSLPPAVTARIAEVLDAGAAPLVLGGDHSITLPVLRAMAARHGPVAVVQFDAHSDLWPDDDPARIDHGTFLYKAVREGLVDVARSVQIGIRTVTADRLGVPMIDAREVHEEGPAAVARKARAIVGDAPAYLTFDIDALDPAFAPGTGTPVWGGLASWQAQGILRDLAGLRVLGGDVVEVSPPYDPTGATAIAGAHAATEILCLIGWHRLGRG
ncbi:agmatinase [Rubellimicrobium sp. CFH 75288]|uniref:agmatinase n=1 Tax=Rubellimicrobium sp. CFH 75288 TaxID=2697034 RepID=UPI0014137720|nr:agmatinase [Rubellimicrobium sp. CFH 75288]NAZ36256.1 agmatinase [Rubellimicrobium sp. CFH 75288]